MGVIYLRTNLVNGMQYVGQAQDFKSREKAWKSTNWRYANQFLTNDREKYGLENFKTEILEKCDNSQLDEKEIFWIKKLNTIFPSGYNINKGGSKGFECAEITKKKISEANSGENNYWFGKKRSEEFKKQVSEKMKGIPKSEETKKKMSENNAKYWLGKTPSEETRKKLSNAFKGRFINREDSSKRVFQYKDDVLIAVYPSRNEAARQTGFRATSIGNCCNGGYYSKGKWVNYIHLGGFRFSYTPLDIKKG